MLIKMFVNGRFQKTETSVELLNSMTKKELLDICQWNQITGYMGLTKDELVEGIYILFNNTKLTIELKESERVGEKVLFDTQECTRVVDGKGYGWGSSIPSRY